MMRNLFFVIVIAALAYSGYWWIGSTAKESALKGWLETRRAEGWVADYQDMTVSGYPNRFDTTITELHLADPYSGWSWTAPAFQILALSYQPNHVIAVWPGNQTIASPWERIELNAETMRGSVRFEVNTQLALKQSVIELRDLTANSTAGWFASLSEGQLAIRQSEPGTTPDFGYDVSLTARHLTLPKPLKAAMDPANLLPPSVAKAEMRVTPVFDAKWDRSTVEGPNPELQTLNVQNVSLAWGEMQMTVTGRLDVDERGYADGELKVIAQNWRDMVDVGVRAGWVPRDLRDTLESGLGLLARLTGDANRLDVPLTFRNGVARLGPVPVGRAPLLVYRQ